MVVFLLILLAIAENNWISYAWRSAQLFTLGDDGRYGIGKRPDHILNNAAVNADGSTTILAVGDIVSCPTSDGIKGEMTTLASWFGLDDPLDPSKVPAAQTVELAKRWQSAPILALGDLVYRRGTPHEFSDCFDPIWGEISERTLPAPGNHEYLTPAAFAYFDYWGQQAGPDRRGYYSVQNGNWLILSLNSEIAGDADSAQGIWLSEVLASSSAQCILAFYHRPAFTSKIRGVGSADKLFAQLAGAGADVILSGHNHFYERTFPMNSHGTVVAENGTVSFVVGTGGRSRKRVEDTASFIAKTLFHEQGVLRLELRSAGYDWAFHSINGGVVLDQGSRDCSAI